MKRLILVALLVAGLASPAMAGPIGETGMVSWQRVGGYYTGSGGEFTLFAYTGVLENDAYAADSKNAGTPDPSFQTFCLELDEFLEGNPMNYVVNSAVADGGKGGPTPDPLSFGTAWLYNQFVSGTLQGYFTGVRTVEAGLLQNAIWMLEEEMDMDVTNPYIALAMGQFGGTYMDNAGVGYLNVYVLNNTYRQKNMQDFLWQDDIPTPDGGATLMLLGGALIGIGALRRKYRG